ncbi:hypothetical protein RyT2_17010 [Pseudolactococcus yaeyamensis]
MDNVPETPEKSHPQPKDFVQDNFFEKGHWWLKIRQVLFNLAFLAVLVVPIVILFNSLQAGHLWKSFYHWTYTDGFELTDYLNSAILLAFVVILVCSLAFLYRNNYREQNVYPKKKTYDAEKLAERKAILDKMYTERFGDLKSRESARYYAVDGEKNLPDRMIEDLFKENGVEIR